MARRRNGQCPSCGLWLQYPQKRGKCGPCKAPVVRAAKSQLRAQKRADREEVVLSEVTIAG